MLLVLSNASSSNAITTEWVDMVGGEEIDIGNCLWGSWLVRSAAKVTFFFPLSGIYLVENCFGY